MYVVKRASGEKELNAIVETKDVENKSELRGTEGVKIQCAELFFHILEQDGYKVYFKTQINNRQMEQSIVPVIYEDHPVNLTEVLKHSDDDNIIRLRTMALAFRSISKCSEWSYEKELRLLIQPMKKRKIRYIISEAVWNFMIF